MTNTANAAETKLRNELKLSLLKMPKKIRTMPLHEFTTTYNEDVKAVLLSDVNSKHDRLLLLLDGDDAAGMQAPGTKMKKTVRKPARKPTARGGGDDGGAEDASAVPMTVTRTTRKRKAAMPSEGEGTTEDDDAPPTTLRRSARTRSRTATAADMVTPMPSRRGGRQTPFGDGSNTKGALTPGIVPGSASRMPKLGEIFFSKNGTRYNDSNQQLAHIE